MTYTLLKSRVIAEIKECLLLAVPLAGAQLSQAATTFVDTVMMGILGSQIIAAGALGAVTFQFLINVGSALVSAVSPIAAEAYGGGRVEQVGRVVRQAKTLASSSAATRLTSCPCRAAFSRSRASSSGLREMTIVIDSLSLASRLCVPF